MPRRALVTAGQIFQSAIGTGRATVDASAGMVAQLKPRPPVQHYPHVTDVQLPDLLQRIDRYTRRPETVAAVKLAVLTFVRGGELRYAEWSEFDFENAEWRVPSGRMKGPRCRMTIRGKAVATHSGRVFAGPGPIQLARR